MVGWSGKAGGGAEEVVVVKQGVQATPHQLDLSSCFVHLHGWASWMGQFLVTH